MKPKEYWVECVQTSFAEHGIEATGEQIEKVATDVMNGHEHYGMAFYSPPPSDRIEEINREHDSKIKRLEREHDKYRESSEAAIKRALGRHRDDDVSIGDGGEVFLYGGRTVRIQ